MLFFLAVGIKLHTPKKNTFALDATNWMESDSSFHEMKHLMKWKMFMMVFRRRVMDFAKFTKEKRQ